ncbi:thiamine-phosphate pyrophosphorylase [Chitinophaga dinghuensis]|uniref:Thiamine-phosphate synthase n=1 Tax=Chitinophaga dinghuensis TaxID=1539050 RepID=A0A327W5U2_9BACT|nr:thiamine phosphate synthase [Chitinophaga dinghuensis]RAJ85370.1 thiamine-phosphate pyrophosphorylase [Chitinophaga dinghuensis]
MINRLHYISQGSSPAAHLVNIHSACDAGCTWIQLRIKNSTPEEILPVAAAARKITADYGAALIINDYPEIARQTGADGVHVGLNDMSVAEAREIVGPQLIVGGTSNLPEHIIQHHKDGADYVGLGPYRFTATKEKLSPIIGLQGYINIMQTLQQQRISIPVIAIGGILEADIPGLLAAGIHGIAVSGLITAATDKSLLVYRLYQSLNNNIVCSH